MRLTEANACTCADCCAGAGADVPVYNNILT